MSELTASKIQHETFALGELVEVIAKSSTIPGSFEGSFGRIVYVDAESFTISFQSDMKTYVPRGDEGKFFRVGLSEFKNQPLTIRRIQMPKDRTPVSAGSFFQRLANLFKR